MNAGRWRLVAAPLVGIVVFGVIWEVFVRVGGVKPFILLPPSRIATELVDRPAFYLSQSGSTALHAGLGLLAAVVGGVALGSCLAAFRFVEQATTPVLVLVGVAPWVAYFTSVVAWLGAGTPPVVFLVALVSVPAFVFATVTGIRSADPAARELFASVDAGVLDVFWRLRLPSAAAGVLSTARYVIGLALAASYYGEGANLSTHGLGSIGRRAANATNPDAAPTLWASVFATAVIGVVALGLVTLVERSVLSWHASQRPGRRGPLGFPIGLRRSV